MNSVGTPDPPPIRPRIASDPIQRARREVPYPNVVFAIADVEREPHSIRRQPRVGVSSGGNRDRFLTAFAIDPDECAARTDARRFLRVDEGALARNDET